MADQVSEFPMDANCGVSNPNGVDQTTNPGGGFQKLVVALPKSADARWKSKKAVKRPRTVGYS